MRNLMVGVAGVMFAIAMLSAQQPTCKNCPGTYISATEVQAYVQRAVANNLIDQQIRAVDIGKINLDVGVVYRAKLDKPAEASVAEHDLVSELYHVIEGSATLVLGPDIINPKRRPADLETVRGITYQLKPGDVVIIPAGTGHWFTKIDDHIVYLMARIDPDKVTPNKTEVQSKAYLSGQQGGPR